MDLDGPKTHSTIEKLPKELTESVMRMAVDNIWPEDFEGNKAGHPRYKDMASYVHQKGHPISVYAIGRFCRRLHGIARMKNAALLVRDAMVLPDKVQVSETQKAAAEMLTAVIIETISSQDEFDAKDINNLARAARDCTQVTIAADKYIRERIQKNIAAASEQIGIIAKKKNIDPATLKAIREQVYGIIDDRLGYTENQQKRCLEDNKP
jgi:hypothetical protein